MDAWTPEHTANAERVPAVGLTAAEAMHHLHICKGVLIIGVYVYVYAYVYMYYMYMTSAEAILHHTCGASAR